MIVRDILLLGKKEKKICVGDIIIKNGAINVDIFFITWFSKYIYLK